MWAVIDVSREVLELLFGERLGFSDRGSWFVDLFKGVPEECLTCYRILKVATPSARSREILAWSICRVRMSILEQMERAISYHLLLLKPFPDPVNKSGENHAEAIHEWIGLAN